MSSKAVTRILSIFGTHATRDFSVFVSSSPKAQKERLLKRAADKAIIDQRKIVEAVA